MKKRKNKLPANAGKLYFDWILGATINHPMFDPKELERIEQKKRDEIDDANYEKWLAHTGNNKHRAYEAFRALEDSRRNRK